MTELPFSDAQRKAILALRSGEKTTPQIAAAAGAGRGAGSLIQALYARGIVRYRGGPKVRPGKGWWFLTERGRAIAETLERTEGS